jgi:uncharacterized protein (DUF433 family)
MTDILTVDRFRTGKTYTIRQAAALAHVSMGTVRNWLFGFADPGGYHMAPLFGGKVKTEETTQVSFLELAELIIAARYRRYKIKLQRIRDAHLFAREEWGVPYPFASLDLTTVGGHILHRFEELNPDSGPQFVVLSSPNQFVLPELVAHEMDRFDYSPLDRFAERWYPHGKDVPIVVDPHYAGGRPTIAGRGVTVEIIRKRFYKARESVVSIARDFRLTRGEVEEAIRERAA